MDRVMEIQETLREVGLNDGQAAAYAALLRGGAMRASEAAKKIGRKRAIVYRNLQELQVLGLVERSEGVGEVSVFSAKHPSCLDELVSREEKRLRANRALLAGALSELSSEFNLSSGKPGVRFFEGKEGVERVLEDSLRVREGETIFTYADIEAVEKHMRAINERYVKKRERLKIKKKALILDTPFAREYMKSYYTAVTDTRLISPATPVPFRSLMEIYDGKVSYVTFEKERMIGVIVEDRAIYDMHRYLFESMWEKAERVGKRVEF